MDWLEQVLRLGVLLGVALLVWQVLLVAAVVWSGLPPPRLTAGVALGRGLPTEPADTGLAGRAEWFELPEQRVGGRRFAGGRTPGFVLRGERAGGPVVLLVSGHGGGRFGGLDRARQFAPHVSWLASYDQRGRGDSELPRCTMGVAEPADAVAVLEQVREAIAERSGDRAEAGRPVVLWGGSMGSATALDAARRLEQDGQEVAGVLLEGGYGRWRPSRR
jgi:pimeloyl-ACP methyl ester carboxylesterase